MKIIVLGGAGYIGRALCMHIYREIDRGADYELVVIDRQGNLGILHPRIKYIQADIHHIPSEIFSKIIRGGACLINCIYDASNNNDQNQWIKRLGSIIAQEGIGQLIHLSDTGILTVDRKAYCKTSKGSSYLHSQIYAEQAMKDVMEKMLKTSVKSNTKAIILRLSLIYGSSCNVIMEPMRYVAGSIGVLCVGAEAKLCVSPVYLGDLIKIIWSYIIHPEAGLKIVDVVGPQRISKVDIIFKLRQWMGLPKVKVVTVPSVIAKLMVNMNIIPAQINAGLVDHTSRDLFVDKDKIFDHKIHGVKVRPMDVFFEENPAGNPERWHARIGFLRPFLVLFMIVTWIAGALVGITQIDKGEKEIDDIVKNKTIRRGAVIGFSLMDLYFAFSVMFGGNTWKKQLGAVLGYTLGLGVFRRYLWKDLYGGLIKNIPIIGLILLLWKTQNIKNH